MLKQNKVKVMVLKRPVNWFLSSGAVSKVITEDQNGIIQSNQLIADGELFNTMELSFES